MEQAFELVRPMDDIAQKRAERARRKAARANAPPEEAPEMDTAGSICKRVWVPVPLSGASTGRRVRVVSWNMLAQCLVRRDLFPGSDCLKVKDRLPGMAAELTAYDFDLGCFQEVDMIEEHGRVLSRAGYAYEYERGYAAKKHGVMIAWRIRSDSRTCFNSPAARHVVRYDDAAPWGGTVQGTSSTRITRNVALLLALPFADGNGGVIVATTHLFWHPRYAYERVRQAAVLVQEIEAFREGTAWADWPVVLGGDFNDQPHSPTYTVLTGKGFMYADTLAQELEPSRIVHTSVDEARGLRTVHYAATVTEGGDEDRVLGRYRAAQDGELLTVAQLLPFGALRRRGSRPTCFQSVYAEKHVFVEGSPYFKDRGTAPERYDQSSLPLSSDPRQTSSYEPKWTLYSTLFHLTLDYILVAPRCDDEGPSYPRITALLRMHPDDALHPGVPRCGMCSSDHVMIGAELEL